MTSTNKNRYFGLIFSLALFACIIAAVVFSASAAGKSSSQEGLAAVRQSLTRAVVECYALEGAYPPSLEYIEEYYGITVNEAKYFVNYSLAGENMMPTITVLPKD